MTDRPVLMAADRPCRHPGGCKTPADWLVPGHGPRCDTHARQAWTPHLTVPTDRITRVVGGPAHGDPSDWRCPDWAVDALTVAIDELRARTASAPPADQPALWEEDA